MRIRCPLEELKHRGGSGLKGIITGKEGELFTGGIVHVGSFLGDQVIDRSDDVGTLSSSTDFKVHLKLVEIIIVLNQFRPGLQINRMGAIRKKGGLRSRKKPLNRIIGSFILRRNEFIKCSIVLAFLKQNRHCRHMLAEAGGLMIATGTTPMDKPGVLHIHSKLCGVSRPVKRDGFYI